MGDPEINGTRPRTALAIIKFGAKGAAPAGRAFRKGDKDVAIRIVADAVFGRGGYRRMTASGKTQAHDNVRNIRAELLGSGYVPLHPDQVRNVRVPTLLINGQRSIGLFHRITDRLEELQPCNEWVEVPGASHRMHEDNPTAYNSAVLSFLTNHR